MTALLTVRNLSLMRNSASICENLSLQFLPGEFWGVLGMNGRGKSTLLQTFAGLLPFEGEIFIQEDNIHNLSRRFIAQRIGLLLQHENHYLTVSTYEAIKVGRYAFKEKSADLQNLKTLINFFDLGHLVNNDIVKLSGGEQQRIRIARLFYQDPCLFFLDEPLNHLDFVYQLKILNRLKAQAQIGKAVIIAGHHLQHMQSVCSHFLLLLRDGSVLLGPKEEVLTTRNLELVFSTFGYEEFMH